ncbi:MAG: hypothetical protein E7653_05035 [Ruminococcaceae bacterium]|nr:hypothetical protein [Oscillospiraceae bacterium]
MEISKGSFLKARMVGVPLLILSLIWMVKASYPINDAVMIAGTVIAVLSIALLLGKIDVLQLLRKGKRIDIVFSGLFTLLFTAMVGYSELFGSRLFASEGLVWKLLSYGVFLPIYVLSCFVLLLWVTQKAVYGFDGVRSPDKKTLWICTGVVAFVSVLFFLACPNGLLYDDGVYIWEQGLYHAYSDWHPVCFTLLVRLCSLIYPHPVSFIILQTVIWILTQHLILRILNRHYGALACKIYCVASMTLGIITYKYLVYLYKDPLFSLAILAFSACLLDYIKGHKGVCNFVLLVTYGLMAALTRHMMIVPVALTLVVVIIVELVQKWKTDKKAWCYLAAVLAVLLLLNSVVYNVAMKATDAEENADYVTYTIPIYMLGAYAASDYEIDPETVELMERVMPVEEWEAGYNQNIYWADTLTRSWGYIGPRIQILDENVSGGELIAANFRFFKSHPIYYAKSLLNTSSLMWEISRPESYAEWFYAPFDNGVTASSLREVEGYELVSTGATEVLTPVTTFASTMPVVYNVTCRGGFSLFLILLMCYLSFRKGHGKVALIALPMLTVVLLLFLSMPAPDPRYILGIIEIAVLLLAVTLTMKRKDKQSDDI